MPTPNSDSPCPCDSNQTFKACCAPLIKGSRPAKTAEQLMRSRYSAFATGAVDYLIATLIPKKQIELDRDELLASCHETQWQKLEIIDTKRGGPTDQRGVVEFKAYYSSGGHSGCLHERSRFQKKQGRWFYSDGDISPE